MLHNVQFVVADVLSTYMMTPKREKMWIVLCPEFWDDACKSAIVVRVLYRLQSIRPSFRAHFAQCMHELGYESCKADPDLWQKLENRMSLNIIHTY